MICQGLWHALTGEEFSAFPVVSEYLGWFFYIEVEVDRVNQHMSALFQACRPSCNIMLRVAEFISASNLP